MSCATVSMAKRGHFNVARKHAKRGLNTVKTEVVWPREKDRKYRCDPFVRKGDLSCHCLVRSNRHEFSVCNRNSCPLLIIGTAAAWHEITAWQLTVFAKSIIRDLSSLSPEYSFALGWMISVYAFRYFWQRRNFLSRSLHSTRLLPEISESELFTRPLSCHFSTNISDSSPNRRQYVSFVHPVLTVRTNK